MTICRQCQTEFEPSVKYKEQVFCTKECYITYRKNNIPEGSIKTQFKKGQTAFNKGKSWRDWMPQESAKRCLQTAIHLQEGGISPLSFEENRFLPHNTKTKGTITRRLNLVSKTRNWVEPEYGVEYYINIDWKGNRHPNYLYKRWVWEVHHQQDIPKGMVVYVIDQNPDNIRIDNLELITRAELLKRNRKNGKSKY